MKLSINMGINGTCPEQHPLSPVEAMRPLSNAGFCAMDINFTETIRPYSYMQRDGWREMVAKAAEAARCLGIETSQCHLPFYNFATPGCEDLEMRNEMFGRSLEAAGMMGVQWAVFHTGNAPDAVLSVRESKRRTLEYLKPFLERAAELGVGIAIENLFIPEYLHNTHRHCSNVEDVIDMVDTLGEGAGVCWDFGHANLCGDDQCECLRALGSKLKVLHVHDNGGRHDDHSVPYSYCCTVPWERILPVLGEIGYSGNFSLELVTAKYPESSRNHYLHFVAEIGQWMMAQTGCASAENLHE